MEKETAFRNYAIHLAKNGDGCNYATIGKRLCVAQRYLDEVEGLTLKDYRKWRKENAQKIVFDHANVYDLLSPLLQFVGINKCGKRLREPKPLASKKEVSESCEREVNAFALWLQNNNDMSTHTVRSYITAMREYFAYADKVSNELVRAYMCTLTAQGLKPNTINLRLCAIRAFAKMKRKQLDVKRIKIHRVLDLENVPSETEFRKLTEWLKQQGKMRFYFAVLAFGLTGARISEMLQVTWEQIETGEAVMIGKGRKQRRLFFPRQFQREAVQYAKANNLHGLLMTNKTGEPITRRGFCSMLKIYGAKCGIDKCKMHPHAFRHMFAKMYLKKSKGDIAQLSALLGHSKLDTTQIYIQKSKDEQRKEYDRIVTW